ncbi:MAG: hypothetical protein JWO05_645 [Gemmatimonadetes bacterium]|nr:hypothetical protein [Gemmatimonadota bacterium]
MRAEARHYSLRHFFAEAIGSLTDADGAFWRTIRVLIRQPGELTRRYMLGQRVAWKRPLQLFLTLNVLFFIVGSPLHMNVFSTRLGDQIHGTWHKGIAQPMVLARLRARATDADHPHPDSLRIEEGYAAYAHTFDSATATQAKTLVIAMVPLLALVVALVNAGRGRPGVQHLVFALHFYSAFFVLIVGGTLLAGLALAAFERIAHVKAAGDADQLLGAVMLFASGVYLSLAQRRAYGDGRVAGVVRGALLSVGVAVSLMAYRALLFFVTFYTT